MPKDKQLYQPLLIDSSDDYVEESSVEKKEPPPPPPPAASDSILKVLNDEEYWPIYVGLALVLLTIILVYMDVEIAFIGQWDSWHSLRKNYITWTNFMRILCFIGGTLFVLAVAHVGRKRVGYPLVCYTYMMIIVLICNLIGSYKPIREAGAGAAVWCIIFGLFLRYLTPGLLNIPQATPKLVSGSDQEVETEAQKKARENKNKGEFSLEFMIKISIVLLAISLVEVVKSGGRGLMVAWLDTIMLLVVVYYICIRGLLMPKDDAIITAAGICICGSSAANAIFTALNSGKEAMQAIIAVMSVMTIPQIPFVPFVAHAVGFNPQTTGAWIGGSIDSTGAVSACASLRDNPETVHSAIITKMVQNLLIGPVALFVTAWWRNERKPSILWKYFPKFVIGFLITSIITSSIPSHRRDIVIAKTFVVSEWFSAISFVQIGKEIDLQKIFSNPKMYKVIFIAYCIGQTIDLLTTMGWAYLSFTVIS